MDLDFEYWPNKSSDQNDPGIVYINQKLELNSDFKSIIHDGTFQGKPIIVKKVVGLSKVKYCNIKTVEDFQSLQKVFKHENLVSYVAFKYAESRLIIAMELCEINLEDYLKNSSGTMCTNFILKQMSAGLSVLHSNGLPHGNLKPSNVLLNPSKNVVKLSDYGLGDVHTDLVNKYLDDTIQFGVLDWSSPEDLQAYIDNGKYFSKKFTSDVFAMGCLFYYILTEGKHPFGNILERTYKILRNTADIDKDLVVAENVYLLPMVAEMIHFNANKRPVLEHILVHPNFWSLAQTRSFIEAVQVLHKSNKNVQTQILDLHKALQQSCQDNDDFGFKMAADLLECLFGKHNVLDSTPNNKLRKENLEKYADCGYRNLCPYFLELLWIVLQNFKDLTGLSDFFSSSIYQSSFLQARITGLSFISQETPKNDNRSYPVTTQTWRDEPVPLYTKNDTSVSKNTCSFPEYVDISFDDLSQLISAEEAVIEALNQLKILIVEYRKILDKKAKKNQAIRAAGFVVGWGIAVAAAPLTAGASVIAATAASTGFFIGYKLHKTAEGKANLRIWTTNLARPLLDRENALKNIGSKIMNTPQPNRVGGFLGSFKERKNTIRLDTRSILEILQKEYGLSHFEGRASRGRLETDSAAYKCLTENIFQLGGGSDGSRFVSIQMLSEHIDLKETKSFVDISELVKCWANTSEKFEDITKLITHFQRVVEQLKQIKNTQT